MPAGRERKLTIFNREQWIGDYLAAGVIAIEMDLANLGADPLLMRFAMKNDLGPGAAGFTATDPFLLPADGAWHHAVFPLTESAMTRLNSLDLTLADLLANVVEARILHSMDPSLTGDNIRATLGVDNIQAVYVPEPTAGLLLTIGAIFLLSIARATPLPTWQSPQLRSNRNLARDSVRNLANLRCLVGV